MSFANDGESSALWGGRFAADKGEVMVAIGESISYDRKLYYEDILGSIAHVTMLEACGIIPGESAGAIRQGLAGIRREIENGDFTFDPKLEDIHMHIETRLIELIGDDGKKMHTARSRNDQVSVDVHLFMRRRMAHQKDELLALCGSFMRLGEKYEDVIFPGYTHLQVAQPIRLGHYFLAYFWKFRRDLDRLSNAYDSANVLTLGSGAFAGVNYNTEREILRKLLDFETISENSMDAVSERDYQFDYLYFASVLYAHISRFCEEFILYATVEFGFFELDDSIATGSSIMPQKKNPDLAELLRGKSARVISALNRAMLLVKSQPLTYNRDLQEDKENLFDAFDEVDKGIAGMKELLDGFTVSPQAAERSLLNGYATATDLADALVAEKGVSFRDAHEIVGKLVKVLETTDTTLPTVDKKDRAAVHEFLADDAFYEAAIRLDASADKKLSRGGTAKSAIDLQKTKAQDSLDEVIQASAHWQPPSIEALLERAGHVSVAVQDSDDQQKRVQAALSAAE